jgi:Putative transposase of IS4/5 family (DUF4096)
MARTEPELTDAQWAALAPLPPPQRPAIGRPNNDHRQIVEAMVWLARTGAPWRDLPSCYGSSKTVASRFYRWRQQGISSGSWSRSSGAPMPAGSWTGCPPRGRQCGPGPPARRPRPPPAQPAGPEKGIVHPQDEALGASRGGLRTKLHLRTDGHGRPLVIQATPGQRHEVTQLEALLDAGAVKRTGPMGGRVGGGRASGRPSWPGTRAMRIRVCGGCCAAVASPR